METSMLLTQIIGPILALFGLGLLINKEHYIKMFNNFVKDPDTILSLIAPVTLLVLGLLVVLNHNVWAWSSDLIITLVGWLLIAKGATWLLLPSVSVSIMKRFSPYLSWGILVDGIILLLAGGYLVYLGYFITA